MQVSLGTRLLAVAAMLTSGAPLEGQVLSGRAAAGAALPLGGSRESRSAGPSAMLSVEARLSRRWSFRLEGERSVLNGPEASEASGLRNDSRYQDLRIVGASLSAVYRPTDGDVVPYLLVGAGSYRLQRVDAASNRQGTTGAVQLGIGLEGSFWHRVHPFIETRAVVHFTDYGSSGYAPTTHSPIVLGVRIQ